MITYLLLTLFFVVCQGFFSGMETGMVSVLRPRAEHAAREGSRSAALLVYFLHRPGIMIATALIGVNISEMDEGTLEKVDIFGRTSKQDIYPLDHIKCRNCGCEYSIKWKKVDSGELVPVPTNTSIKQEIVNTMNYLKIRKDGKKEI